MAGKTRAALLQSQLEDLADPAPRDFDPEEEIESSAEGEESGSEDDEHASSEKTAREHYANIGKSRLRQPTEPALGPQYAGSKIARDALISENDDEHDPFAALSSDDMSSEAGSPVEGDGDDHEEDSDDSDKQDSSSETSQDEVTVRKDADRAELRLLMAQERKLVAGTLSQAVKEDAEKGRAVKAQRATFDSLLNARIKLQKAMVGANTLSGLVHDHRHDDTTSGDEVTTDDMFRSAETAAFNLWQSLTNLRDALDFSRNSSSSEKRPEKRKHDSMSADTPTSVLFAHMQQQEDSSRLYRAAVLDKWSVKTRGAASLTPRNRMNQTEQTRLSEMLDAQLARPDGRLVARTRVPRSCAPVQLARLQTSAKKQRTSSDDHEDDTQLEHGEEIYDDTDFYGVLLSRLLEQRGDAVDTSALLPGSGTGSENASSYKLRRDAKTKRPVDNKASKGRRMKYTVHEKLQNFTAPEDRGSWDEGRVDKLFGSLFGARMALREEDRESEDDVEESFGREDERGDEELRLFHTS